MTPTPTPDTNSGETPTPRTDAEEFHASTAQNIMCVRASFARELERELSRPVAPVTGMPEGCPTTIRFGGSKWTPRLHAYDMTCEVDDCLTLEILPAGSRERLRALAGWLEEESGLDCENEGLLNKTPCGGCSSCRARKYALTIPASPCLCGHTLGEHVPDKDIGCTEFRPQG